VGFSDFGDGFGEWTGSFFEGFEIGFFVVGFVVLPAAEEDTLPFVGEAAEDGVMTAAFVSLLLVVGFGPEGLEDGLSGPLIRPPGLTLRAVVSLQSLSLRSVRQNSDARIYCRRISGGRSAFCRFVW